MDKYGHVNNMVYYGYFDTVVTDYLIRQAGLDTDAGESIGLVVESHCNYHKPVAFPAVTLYTAAKKMAMHEAKMSQASIQF